MAKMKQAELGYRKFLSKAENFKVATEVFDHFEEVRKYLQKKYWTAVKRLIERHRLSREFGKWKVTADDDRCPADKDYGIAFDPRKEGSSLYCRAYLQQGEPSHRFPVSFGIVWRANEPPKKEPDLPELRALRKYLTEDLAMTKPTYKWWIARGTPGYELHSTEVMTQLATDDTIQRLQATEFVQFFFDTRKMVERLNEKIAKSP